MISAFIFVAILTVHSRGDSSLVILQNEDGVETLAPAVLEKTVGGSFSLLCSGRADPKPFWSKNAHRRVRPHSESKQESNLLRFKSFSYADEGWYVCKRHKVKKKLLLVTKKQQRFKRDSDSSRYNPFENQPSDFRDSLDKLEEYLNKVNEANKDQKVVDYFNEDSNYQYRESNPVYNIDQIGTKEVVKSPVYVYAFIFLAAIGIFVLLYLVVKCFHEESNGSYDQYRQARSAQCSHNACRRRRRHNPNAECITRTLARSHRTAPVATDLPVCLHVRCCLERRTNPGLGCLLERSPPDAGLDLPPSYDVSAGNSGSNTRHNSVQNLNEGFDDADACTLPPTYEEALFNIALSAPDSPPAAKEGDGGQSSGVNEQGSGWYVMDGRGNDSCEVAGSSGDHDSGGGCGGGSGGGNGGDSGGGGGDSGGGGSGGDSGGGGGDSGGGGGDSGGGGGDSGGGGGGDD